MVFLVAEIGVNWNGDFKLLNDMLLKIKEIGCNAAKFQAFTEKIIGNHPLKGLLMKSSLNEDNVSKIDDLAKSIGIEWFCTPMYPDAVNWLEPYVKRYKIRMADSKPLLDGKSSKLIEMVLEKNKEVFVSSQQSPKGTKYFDHPKIKWLYCVPKYPCGLSDLDFRNISDFDGYSNHCPHFLAPLIASTLGADIIEIHVTADKSKNYIDNNVSFDFNELKTLIELFTLTKKIKF